MAPRPRPPIRGINSIGSIRLKELTMQVTFQYVSRDTNTCAGVFDDPLPNDHRRTSLVKGRQVTYCSLHSNTTSYYTVVMLLLVYYPPSTSSTSIANHRPFFTTMRLYATLLRYSVDCYFLTPCWFFQWPLLSSTPFPSELPHQISL